MLRNHREGDTLNPERPLIEQRILSALRSDEQRIPVLLGGCGSGRTALLGRVAELLDTKMIQYIDAERATSTPEGFYAAVVAHSPYGMPTPPLKTETNTARASFDAVLNFFKNAQSKNGDVPTFLIDEALELRLFESFPGLRGVLRELLDTLVASQNRFVLTSRYVARTHRLLRDASACFEVVHVASLTPAEVATTLRVHGVGRDEAEQAEVAQMVHALTDGRPRYVTGLAEALAAMDGASGGDPVSALASQLAVNAPLSQSCRFCYELRLHRARGYGALKAILRVLADEEPLRLTEIAKRLQRTPGSTKDYLTWLEDVDLITVREKRYSFNDPLMRLWVRLHCQPVAPDEADLAREVQEYAVTRLASMEPLPSVVVTNESRKQDRKEKAFSIIEID